ncbi:ATP-binding protein [Vibrio genomosp. F10]|uniref:ATP-binding protein n=1 Tax=Vibrio genomosp. F10 TaxID=723171 RepID=UPI0002EB21DF|nr:ATP-binding protein [Vibrio genomosp. F10]OEF04376.1 two-component sensor histidine kinase [Vibrio genomosp. F10 str. 9ZD137]
MFRSLFIYLSATIVFAIFFAAIVLDPLYIHAIKQDELAYTRGINQVVSEDVFNHQDKQARLSYWAERFSYRFSLKTYADIDLPEPLLNQLKGREVFADISSGWAIDNINLYYYHPGCDCYLIMTKNYGSHGLLHKYLLSFLGIVILCIAVFIFCYVYQHKKQVRKLSKVYKAYGKGLFSVRADTSTAAPYSLLANTFNQMASQIEALLQEQRTLVYGVSHDLRTPIARLRFALDMSRGCQTVEQYQDKLQDMDLDLDELDSLVNEWLFYAQMGSQPALIDRENLQLSELLSNTVNKVKVLYPSIESSLDLQSGWIDGDTQLLNRCFENLIINAFKFADSQIKISLINRNQQRVVLIEDDGSGIKKESQEQIMQPFVKLDSSRSNEGFGLGLAIVKSILDKHHAQLTIKDSSLGGACFMVIFKSCNKHQGQNTK